MCLLTFTYKLLGEGNNKNSPKPFCFPIFFSTCVKFHHLSIPQSHTLPLPWAYKYNGEIYCAVFFSASCASSLSLYSC